MLVKHDKINKINQSMNNHRLDRITHEIVCIGELCNDR